MIVWGSDGEFSEIKIVETKWCPTCERQRPFKLFVKYRYSHLWYVFQWVSEKQYLELCDICRRGIELDAKAVEATLSKHPIPFSRRFSGVIGFAFFALLISLMIAREAPTTGEQRERDYLYISAPRANDYYMTDISHLSKQASGKSMYGVMRVKSVMGDRVLLNVSRVGYDRYSGSVKDMRSGKAGEADYYHDGTIELTIADLMSMRQREVISGVAR